MIIIKKEPLEIQFDEWKKNIWNKIILFNDDTAESCIYKKTEYYRFRGCVLQPNNSFNLAMNEIHFFYFSQRSFNKAIIPFVTKFDIDTEKPYSIQCDLCRESKKNIQIKNVKIQNTG